MADAEGRYAFPHGGADERRRLDLLAARLDPVTKRRIGRLGLAPDVCCLEVGGGRGSITRWLCQDVAPRGQVTATNVQTGFLSELSLPNLTVLRHDVRTDDFPEGSFGLVHVRAVLMHIAAITTMLADSRIRAGIDVDGATCAPISDDGLSRLFLFLGKQSNYTPGSGGNVTTWERDWRLLTGWKRWLLVAGAVHASFTDLALLADQAGIDIGADLPGARSLDITRAYVRALFDRHLRGKPQALLDQPSPHYPEVTFCFPEA